MLINTFSTPIQVTQCKNSIIDTQLINLAYKLKQNPDNKRSYHLGWVSKIFELEDNILFKQFFDSKLNDINNFVNLYQLLKSYSIKCDGIWFNINPQWAYNFTHTHSGCDFSAVYYLQIPKVKHNQSHDMGNKIVFDNPNPSQMNHKFFQKIMNYNEINSNTWAIEPQENMLVMFPSYLPHRVNQNLSKEDRISIAFNFSIK